jgi:hypothetical protein
MMPNGESPEVTLHLKEENGKEGHMNGPMMLGSSIRFQDVAVSFTREPPMLEFDVSTSPRTATRR